MSKRKNTFTDADWELYGEVEQLLTLLRRRVPEDDALRIAFERTIEPEDETLPVARDLRECRRRFYAMPAPKLRHVMAAWPVIRDRESKPVLLSQFDASSVHRVLSITGSPEGCYHAAGVRSCHTFDLSDDGPVLRVLIQEGTSQAEAIETLKRTLAVVSDRWEELLNEFSIAERGDFSEVTAAEELELSAA